MEENNVEKKAGKAYFRQFGSGRAMKNWFFRAGTFWFSKGKVRIKAELSKFDSRKWGTYSFLIVRLWDFK